MRSSKSRSRSKQNRPRTLGNIINRVFESSGPEGKVRGTPQQIIEKYQMLARDAQLSNDRVAAENFLQHAEHYTRMLGEAQREMAAEQEARQQQFGQGNGQNGAQNGYAQNGNRDQRDNRPWRDERSPDVGDQPDVSLIDDPRGEDTGLVETPEARREAPSAEFARRDDRREDRPRRPEGQRDGNRSEGNRTEGNRPDGNRNREENRPPRGPRPPRPDRPQADRNPAGRSEDSAPAEPAPRAEAGGAAPQVAPPMAAPAEAVTPAPAKAEGDAKVRRPRAPRKPKEPNGDGGTGGGSSDPREAAE